MSAENAPGIVGLASLLAAAFVRSGAAALASVGDEGGLAERQDDVRGVRARRALAFIVAFAAPQVELDRGVPV